MGWNIEIKRSSKDKSKKRKVPTSKVVVFVVLALVIAFVAWSCYEMHRLNDISSLAYTGPSVLALGAAAVAAYNWRAKQTDMVQIELKRLELIAELKVKYGDNLPNETLKAMDYLSNE